MCCEIRQRRRVEFSETDLAGIAHFTHSLRWVEAAEAALFREHGLPFVQDATTTLTGWPRGKLAAHYLAPLRFGDEVEVHLRLAEVQASALTWSATVSRLDPNGGPAVPAVRIQVTTLYAVLDRATGRMRAVAIPQELRDRLVPATDGDTSEPAPDTDPA